jgi:hypothetical protein
MREDEVEEVKIVSTSPQSPPKLPKNLPSTEHLPLTLKLSLVKERVSPRAKQLLDHN